MTKILQNERVRFFNKNLLYGHVGNGYHRCFYL